MVGRDTQAYARRAFQPLEEQSSEEVKAAVGVFHMGNAAREGAGRPRSFSCISAFESKTKSEPEFGVLYARTLEGRWSSGKSSKCGRAGNVYRKGAKRL